jgi:uncharacterized phage protein (TIGR02218 family)
MRDIPAALATHLAGDATTLCHCWRTTRGDGVQLGFTDHDADLAFDGTIFRAASGLDAAEAALGPGFAVGGGEVAGALSADALSESDLAAGLWDTATVEVFLVNWTDCGQRLRLSVGTIGEVRREGRGFVAELRGPAHRLEAPQGRLFAQTCDAALGDARCGVDLDQPAFRGEGSVSAMVDAFVVLAEGLSAFADGWFTGGVLTWTSGANGGLRAEVRQHRLQGALARLSLWQAVPRPVAPGDGFIVTAGCDKRFATCRDKFANVENFRGFPQMPGTDAVLGYPAASDGEMDGGSRFR